MRHPIDWGSLAAVVCLCLICAICGYALGWDSQCTKEVPLARGIDHERSTASACLAEMQWRDGLTVACGRATR